MFVLKNSGVLFSTSTQNLNGYFVSIQYIFSVFFKTNQMIKYTLNNVKQIIYFLDFGGTKALINNMPLR